MTQSQIGNRCFNLSSLFARRFTDNKTSLILLKIALYMWQKQNRLGLLKNAGPLSLTASIIAHFNNPPYQSRRWTNFHLDLGIAISQRSSIYLIIHLSLYHSHPSAALYLSPPDYKTSSRDPFVFLFSFSHFRKSVLCFAEPSVFFKPLFLGLAFSLCVFQAVLISARFSSSFFPPSGQAVRFCHIIPH